MFALIRSKAGLIATTIEGKVDEPFGPTVAEWLRDASPGKVERLASVMKLLGLQGTPAGDARYQLLHRTAAAVIEAQRFAAGAAAMIVHSFSPTARWFDDFVHFVALFKAEVPKTDDVVSLSLPDGKPLNLG